MVIIFLTEHAWHSGSPWRTQCLRVFVNHFTSGTTWQQSYQCWNHKWSSCLSNSLQCPWLSSNHVKVGFVLKLLLQLVQFVQFVLVQFVLILLLQFVQSPPCLATDEGCEQSRSLTRLATPAPAPCWSSSPVDMYVCMCLCVYTVILVAFVWLFSTVYFQLVNDVDQVHLHCLIHLRPSATPRILAITPYIG